MSVSYINGNINTPCIVLGPDPADENNVLISALAPATSVHKDSVSESEGTTPVTSVPNADLGTNYVETGVESPAADSTAEGDSEGASNEEN